MDNGKFKIVIEGDLMKIYDDLKSKIMIEKLYEAGEYDFILENFDSNFLFKQYYFTGKRILLDVIREKYDKVENFIKALGSKIGELVVVLYLEKLGYHFVVDNIKRPDFLDTDNLYHYLVKEETFTYEVLDQALVDDFYKTFGNDKNITSEALLFIERCFGETLKFSPELARRDMEMLIEAKKENSNFYVKVNSGEGSCYAKDEGISLRDVSVISFNHELTHFIQRYKKAPMVDFPKCDDKKISSITEKLYEIAKDYTLDSQYADKKYEEYVVQEKGSLDEYQEEMQEDFRKKLGTKELLEEVLSSNDRTKELVLFVENAYVNKEKFKNNGEHFRYMLEYVNFRLKSERKYFKRKMYQMLFGDFLMFQNFIDAYIDGHLFDYYMKHKYHKGVYAVSVHTENYFNKDDGSKFNELLADYVALKKSPQGEVFINHLRKMVGNQLIELLDSYYLNLNEFEISVNKKG